jgi:hypothetical protein
MSYHVIDDLTNTSVLYPQFALGSVHHSANDSHFTSTCNCLVWPTNHQPLGVCMF